MGNVEEQPWGEAQKDTLVILSGTRTSGKRAKLTPPLPLSRHKVSHRSSAETNKSLVDANN